MIFSPKKNILWIRKNQLIPAKVSTNKISHQQSFDYNDQTAKTCLRQLQGQYRGPKYVVVCDEFLYTFVLNTDTVPKDRSSIKDLISEIIPENIHEVVWDYRVAKTDPTILIQITVLSKEFEKLWYPLLSSKQLSIKSIEPESIALSRTIPSSGPAILVYSEDISHHIVLCQKGIVYFSWYVKTLGKEELDNAKTVAHDIFNIEPQEFYSNNSLQVEGYTFKECAVNPLLGAALKSDITGTDSDVLNLSLTDHVPFKNVDPSSNQKSQKYLADKTSGNNTNRNRTLYLAIILLLSAIGFMTFLLVKNSKIKTSSEVTKLETGESITPQVPTPTESPRNISIKILNGSGTPNIASEVETLLDKENYRVVETGNADVFTFVETEILYKASVPSSVIDALDKLLQTDYSVTKDPTLLDSEDVDIIITLGEKL